MNDEYGYETDSTPMAPMDQTNPDLVTREDYVKVIREYLKNDLPHAKEIKFKEFWATLGRAPELTFITPEEIPDFETEFEISRLTYLMSKPSYAVDFKTLQDLEQMRMNYKFKIRRSVGTTKNVTNERTLHSMQIHQGITSHTQRNNGGSSSGGGFFNRVKNMFGG